MLSLLLLVAGKGYATIGEEVYTLMDHSFENGLGDFTVYHWKMQDDEEESEPQLWTYSELHKAAIAYNPTSTEYEESLISPVIDLTDTLYHNVNLEVDYFMINLKRNYNMYIYVEVVDEYTGGGVAEWYDLTKNITKKDSIKYASKTISLDCYVGKKIQIYFTIRLQNSSNGKWGIQKVKLTTNQYFDKKTPVDVNSIADIRALPVDTPFRWHTQNVCQLTESWILNFLRDETGAIAIQGGYGMSGTLFKNTTILAAYTKVNGIGTIVNVVGHYGFCYDNDEYGNCQPDTISEEEYWQNECNVVTMPITEEVYLWDMYDYTYGDIGWYQPHNKTHVTGIVYPTEDGRKRFIKGCWGYSIQLDLSDNEEVLFTKQDLTYS